MFPSDNVYDGKSCMFHSGLGRTQNDAAVSTSTACSIISQITLNRYMHQPVALREGFYFAPFPPLAKNSRMIISSWNIYQVCMCCTVVVNLSRRRWTSDVASWKCSELTNVQTPNRKHLPEAVVVQAESSLRARACMRVQLCCYFA